VEAFPQYLMQAMFVGADTVAVCSGDDGEGRVILKAVGGGWFDMVDARAVNQVKN